MRRAPLTAALACAFALGAGADPVEAWLADLRSDDPAARSRAAEAATQFDADDRAALPMLLEALSHRDVTLRRAAAEAIADVAGAGDAHAVQPLVRALDDSDTLVRQLAARALRVLGRPGSEALRRAAQGSGAAAEAARGALAEVAPPEPTATRKGPTRVIVTSTGELVHVPVTGLEEWPEDAPARAPRVEPRDPEQERVREREREQGRREAERLAAGDLASKRALVQLAMKDSYGGAEAGRVLRTLLAGPDGARLLPDLVPLLGNSHSYVRAQASRMVAAVAGDTSPAMPALVRLLDDPSPGVSAEALRALTASQSLAASASLPIGELLSNESEHLRAAALRALVEQGPAAAAARPAIARALESPLADARRKGIAAAVAVGLDPSLEAALRARLADPDPEILTDAAAVLARSGFAREAAIPALLASLSDDSSSVRADAASALADAPPDATAELALFLRRLTDSDASVKRAVRRSIDALGERALPALRVVASDPAGGPADAALALLHQREIDQPLARADAARRPPPQ